MFNERLKQSKLATKTYSADFATKTDGSHKKG